MFNHYHSSEINVRTSKRNPVFHVQLIRNSRYFMLVFDITLFNNSGNFHNHPLLSYFA